MYFLGFEQARYIFRMLYYFPCCLSITGDVINIKRVNKVRYVIANELRNLFSRNLPQKFRMQIIALVKNDVRKPPAVLIGMDT